MRTWSEIGHRNIGQTHEPSKAWWNEFAERHEVVLVVLLHARAITRLQCDHAVGVARAVARDDTEKQIAVPAGGKPLHGVEVAPRELAQNGGQRWSCINW